MSPDSRVELTVDGKKVSEYQGTGRLSERGDYAPANHSGLYVTVWDTAAVFSKIALTPITGQGKKTR